MRIELGVGKGVVAESATDRYRRRTRCDYESGRGPELVQIILHKANNVIVSLRCKRTCEISGSRCSPPPTDAGNGLLSRNRISDDGGSSDERGIGIAGWGWVDESGTETQTLNVVKLPYIDVKKCLDEAPPDFREYITSDKICAGYTNGTGLCHGDSGGGLAFATSVDGETRYFLRGIASSAPTNKDDCNVHAVTSFTDVQKHAKFLKAFYAGP
ncbi:Clotting factor B [Eumeta japonica]|uniref:Clotting factor B n=1 Tax=Eumeta variegata TaxID=151549 RepID=A0A4C1T9L9_EUMVA|nr:Clotting factor B [Eumeta japonica]